VAIRAWLEAGKSRINLHLRPDRRSDWHCIPGHAVRAGTESLAVEFSSASLQAFETLLQQSGLVDESSWKRQPEVDSQVILSQVRATWLGDIKELVADWLRALPSSLMPVSSGLSESLEAELRCTFDGLCSPAASDHGGSDWLILGVLAERARQRHEAGVGLLHARLSDLGLESAATEPGPLGPEVFCRVVGQAIRARGFNRQESRELYTRFESDVLHELGDVYAGLHSVLARNNAIGSEAGHQGMLLHLPASPRRTVNNRRQEAEVAVRQVAMPPLPSLTEPEDLRPEPLDGSTRAEAIRSLHARLENDEAVAGHTGFPESLVPDLVAALCRSPRLTQRGRRLIEGLEPIIARVLAREAGGLEERDHPLRRLINRIGHLDTADQESELPWSPELYQPLRGLAPDQSPNRALTQAAEVFRKELEERETNYQRQVRTAIKAVEGSERVNEAARVTDEALDDRLFGEPVPRPVLRFVEDEWRNLMMLHYLRSESQEGRWSEALELLDAILDANDPGSQIRAEELLDRLRAFRERTPEQCSDESLENLEEYLRHPQRSRYVKLSAGFRGKPAREHHDGADRTLAYWEKSLESMPVGTWFLEKMADGTTRPIRMAWAGQHRRRFVLVGPSGRKIVDLGLKALSQRLADGELLPISRHDQALVDEGLDRLLENLYRQLVERVITDPETGLCDDGEFRRRLARMLVVAPPCRQQTLIVMSWREQAVDPATLAQLLGEQLPPHTLIGRRSGNRIGLLFHGQAVEAWLVRMLRRVHRVIGSDDGILCAGVAVGDPAIVTAERWLALAEEACEKAPFEWPPAFRYGSVPAERMRHVLRLADRLAGNEALRRNELLLRASRIIPLHGTTRMPAQHELSMTAPDEHGELMDASELVPLAERYGGGARLDDWLMQAVLECLKRPLPSFPEAESGVCIPVLGYTLTEPGLTRFIQAVFRYHQCSVDKLWFCVSEADAMAHPNAVALFMREVRELGGRICLDMRETDPGMARLVRRLPADLIRLKEGSGSQWSDFGRDSMLSAVVTVAHQMGAEVVVSGVSKPARIDALRALGVDYAQGAAVARPRLLRY
jgi:EAL domain-containing protein (putative c-di-GMP-specific phosphodiesterase class I)/ribosome assembly protein YihI (activator of Der GTPase)